MALQCDWFVLCERVIEDTQSGNLTLVNCLDQIQAWSVPSTMPGFAIAARFTRDGAEDNEDGTYEFRLIRKSEIGGEDIVMPIGAELGPGNSVLRVFVNFAVIRLFREETIKFRLDFRKVGQRWRHGPSVPLRVTLQPLEYRQNMAEEIQRVRQELLEVNDKE